MPALETDSWVRAMTTGALLGLIAYSTYDLTNLATLRGWSAKLALINLAWGTIVTRLVAAVLQLLRGHLEDAETRISMRRSRQASPRLGGLGPGKLNAVGGEDYSTKY